MIESSLYGVSTEKIPGLKFKNFKGVEKIFVNLSNKKNKRIWVLEEHFGNKIDIKIITRNSIDRNRQRLGISFTFEESLVEGENTEKWLKLLNYKEVSTNILDCSISNINGYTIEMTKFKNLNDIIDSSEEEEGINVIEDEDFIDNYLVRVFTVKDTVEECEKILIPAFSDLEDYVILKKPDLKIFE